MRGNGKSDKRVLGLRGNKIKEIVFERGSSNYLDEPLLFCTTFQTLLDALNGNQFAFDKPLQKQAK